MLDWLYLERLRQQAIFIVGWCGMGIQRKTGGMEGKGKASAEYQQRQILYNYIPNRSEWVPVRSNLSSSSVCLYMSNQSGSIWHSLYPE